MNNYNVIKQIGKGAFSNVHLCKTDEKYNGSLLLSGIERLKSLDLGSEISDNDDNDNDIDDLFIIKEINIDNLVKKYMNKSRMEIINKIKCNNNNSTSFSVNITPYNNNGVFSKKIMKKLDTEEEYYYKRLKDLIDSEIEILKKLSHKNIIKYFSSNINMSNEQVQIYCIKMEYCNYGDLYTILKKQSNNKVLLSNFKLRNTFGGFEDVFINKFLEDTVCGLKYLHDLNIIHRDIKLHNVLVKNEKNSFLFKLSDFGFACFDLDTELNESLNMSDFDFSTSALKKKYYKLCGTPYYMAPEIILNLEEFEQLATPQKEFLDDDCKMVKFYDKKVDLWSYGICLYELIFNSLPFSGISDIHDLKDFFSRPTTQINLHKKIDNKIIIDQMMKNILKGLLTINPSFRITTNELYNNNDLKNSLLCVNEINSDIESDYNIITLNTNNNPDKLSKNVVYQPIDLNEKQPEQVDNFPVFLTSWDKINKASSLIMKISVDNNFMKWLLNKK